MSAQLRATSRRTTVGMTLVEILIALAIASLMTLTGWRALDALQTSRDRVSSDALQWQQLDDLFAVLEADLRRASFNGFSGGSSGLSFAQAPLDGAVREVALSYQFDTIATADGSPRVDIVRIEAGRSTPLASTRGVVLSYSSDGQRFESDIQGYPRAMRIALVPAGNGSAGPVERVFALR